MFAVSGQSRLNCALAAAGASTQPALARVLCNQATPRARLDSQVASAISSASIRPCSSSSAASMQRPQLSMRMTGRHARAVAAAAGGGAAGDMASVDVEEAKRLMDRSGFRMLDVRSVREYDDGHVTKPARSCFNVPIMSGPGGSPNPNFVAQVASQLPNKATDLIVVCADGGQGSAQAMQLLSAAGYTGLRQLLGGYTEWTKIWSPSGKRKPPPGRWVSTGKEALKSGLNIPGVALSYDEGGNLNTARFAEGLRDGESLPS